LSPFVKPGFSFHIGRKLDPLIVAYWLGMRNRQIDNEVFRTALPAENGHHAGGVIFVCVRGTGN
jgi:hypothetical protein